MFRSRINHLIRAYPSLNLRIEVHRDQHKALALLPGLRYDDISYTGQPDLQRLMNIMGRVEHASMYDTNHSFLDYQSLSHKGIGSYAKGLIMEIRRHFYETTTPKSPMQVSLKLTGMMDTMYTIRTSATFGGRQKASIMIKSCNALVHRESGLTEQIPEWWRHKFLRLLPTIPDNYRPIEPPNCVGKTFSHHVVVPLRDTDTSGRTRHPSYVRYFTDNISIAANRNFYPALSNMLHDYYTMRISVLHFSPSVWGDSLIVETFQDLENELKLHCFVSKGGHIKWYGCLEFYEIMFEPEVEPFPYMLNYHERKGS
ncbi:hypothetical protein PoB_006990800 [Plakobranchus ocellatus]|uniref:Uncharacterized protein n=1 Tax=Plakobranchus ocellatus TaxID=259542 RepID=A0AAV4DH80_9GAST|nr:hypothetical protein PoB_006990800 [Plakobranchus ocellatus]